MSRALAVLVCVLCGGCDLASAWADPQREVVPTVLFVERPADELGGPPFQPILAPPRASADGSEARPFRSIDDALRAAPPGALLRIGEGIFRERISIVRPVALMGRGAGRTRIVPAPAATPAISVKSVDGVQIYGLSVEGAPVCVQISGGVGHRLENVELRECSQSGILARDATMVLAGIAITDIGQGRGGAGVEMLRGSIDARHIVLVRAGRRGFILAGARGVLSSVDVRASALSAVQATDGADVRIVGGTFQGLSGAALYAGGAKLSALGVHVRDAEFALIGNRGAQLIVVGGQLTDYRVAGVALVNSSGSVQKALIARGGTEAAISITRSGRGGAPVSIAENRIQDPGPMGIHITESRVHARANSITGARLDGEKDMGDAVYSSDSELEIEGNVLRGNAGSGLAALRSRVRLVDNTFLGNGRAGVLLLDESRGTASGNLFARNAQSGVEVGERAYASLVQNRFGGNDRFDIDLGCGRGLSGNADMGAGNTFTTPMRTRPCPAAP